MAWELENGRPIYTQLLEQIELKIISGEYEPGSRIPSVRELAAEAKVNPNTMQRAMAELENRGFIITNRTSGRIVTEDEKVISALKQSKALNFTEDYIEHMTMLKYCKEDMIQFIKEGMKE